MKHKIMIVISMILLTIATTGCIDCHKPTVVIVDKFEIENTHSSCGLLGGCAEIHDKEYYIVTEDQETILVSPSEYHVAKIGDTFNLKSQGREIDGKMYLSSGV